MDNYQKMKQNIAQGWNTWNTRSVLSHVLLPEGFAINLCLKEYQSATYLKEAFIGQHNQTVEGLEEEIFPGPHAYDGSYTELNIKYRGIEITVQSGVIGDDLAILVTPIHSPYYPATLVLESGILWNKPGTLQIVDGNLTGSFENKTVRVFTTKEVINEQNVPVQTPYVAMKLDSEIGISTGSPRSIDEIKKILAHNLSKLNQRKKAYGEKAELYNAMQSCLAWDTIYEPEGDRVVSTVSRIWNVGNSGYIMFCWDTYFAAYMASLDNKELAYSNAIEITKAITSNGFVPNVINGLGYVSLDRSQPPVGSMVIREIYRKYKEKWFLEELFDDLFRWNTWYFENRNVGNDLMAWGSNPYTPRRGWRYEVRGSNQISGAKFESGLDNSPMYDDIPFDEESHMMKLADVGLMGLFIMDCKALADIAVILNRRLEEKILLKRAERCTSALSLLWNEKAGIYQNLRTDTGEYSQRLSPTHFYVLLSGTVENSKADEMIRKYLCNEEEFWGEWILPSISRNDPAYIDQEYWRGRIWAPMNFLVYLGLRHYSYEEIRKDFAAKCERLILKEWLEKGHVHENYCADTGEGCNKASSDRFYHWGGLLSLVGLMEAGFLEGIEYPID